MIRLALAALLLISFNILAEYRVYQYLITDQTNPSSDPNKYIQFSTLPPTSFLSYHGSRQAIDLVMSRTWMCPGFTGGNKEFCKSPYEKLKAQLTND